LVDESGFLKGVSRWLEIPWWNEPITGVPTSLREKVPAKTALRYRVVPLREDEREIWIGFYDPFDLLARQDGDQLTIDAKLMERFRNNFYLETMIPQYADNLKSLRGFKFDWTRNDANFDHVYANQAFTHKLNEFGIIHEAEEYNGAFGADWGVDGRFYTDALPFFQKHMVFAGAGKPGAGAPGSGPFFGR
jgi:hypothetical protein